MSGCREPGPPPADARCFARFERTAPGRLRLAEPRDCPGAPVRLVAPDGSGAADRPESVEVRDEAGRLAMTISVRYGPNGRPTFEERTLHGPQTEFHLAAGDERVAFSGDPTRAEQVVRLRAELDPAGRIVRLEKWLDAALEYTQETSYSGDFPARQTVRDGQGAVRHELTWARSAGGWQETMVDGAGRILLQREVPQPGQAEFLDRTDGSPIQGKHKSASR